MGRKPETATRPRSPEPGCTRRLPSSTNTAQLGPSMKAAVSASAPGAEAEAPRPTASEEPKLSKIMALGQKESRPRLFSWLHMEPDELMDLTWARSHRPGLAS